MRNVGAGADWWRESLEDVRYSLPYRPMAELELAATVIRQEGGQDAKLEMIDEELGRRIRQDDC